MFESANSSQNCDIFFFAKQVNQFKHGDEITKFNFFHVIQNCFFERGMNSVKNIRINLLLYVSTKLLNGFPSLLCSVVYHSAKEEKEIRWEQYYFNLKDVSDTRQNRSSEMKNKTKKPNIVSYQKSSLSKNARYSAKFQENKSYEIFDHICQKKSPYFIHLKHADESFKAQLAG